MALAVKIQQLVQSAFVKIDDLASSITYVRSVPGNYTAATDAVAVTETTYANVKCALVKIKEEDLDWWPANTKGQKLLIPYLNLPIAISEDDYVLIDGDRWNIHKFVKVPGNSIHVIYIREP